MKKTKLNILQTAIALFNEFGFANVSLQQIARNLGLSSGNLTYHFPKKADLMNTVYDYFVSKVTEISDPQNGELDLLEMDRRVRQFYHFQQDFRFFYVDLLEIERAFPSIAKKHYQHIDNQISGIYKMLDYNVDQHYLQAYEADYDYQYLARQIWMTTVFWQTQLLVQGKTSTEDDLSKAVWMLIQPHFTPAGKSLFTAYAKQIKSNTL